MVSHKYMDQSASFIRHRTGSSASQYAGELRDAANKLKEEIIVRMDKANWMAQTFPKNSERVQLRNDLEEALDKLIKRKVEDFEFGYIEGRDISD